MLPASKVIPKEMLTVVDRPVIQYVVEEAVAAGIDDFLIVTAPSKRAIEDHFDRNFELEAALEAKGRHGLRRRLVELSEMADFHFTRQGRPLGLGHAVSMGERFAAGEPFVVLLPDFIMRAQTVRRLLDTHRRCGTAVVVLREVPMHRIGSYGCAAVEAHTPGVVRIPSVVEKPAPDAAPSNLAVVGRYLFPPDIFEHLRRVRPGVGGEIQLTDALNALARSSGLHGVIDRAGAYDTGDKLDFLRAQVELGLDHPELGDAFAEVLYDLVARQAAA